MERKINLLKNNDERTDTDLEWAWACKKCQNTKKDLMPLDWLEIIHTIPEYKGKEDRIKTSVFSLLEWIKRQKENRLKYGLRSNLKLNE